MTDPLVILGLIASSVVLAWNHRFVNTVSNPSRTALCVSPCYTTKALTRQYSASYGPSTSFQRSGSPAGMAYARSSWLRYSLSSPSDYAVLAEVADVGLGPQTTSAQREHQRFPNWSLSWVEWQEPWNNTTTLLVSSESKITNRKSWW